MKREKATKNKYKCSPSLWAKWDNHQREVFNQIMDCSMTTQCQDFICHPKMERIAKDHWKTIAHNFACFAVWTHDYKITPYK